jgi:hypothetical protein
MLAILSLLSGFVSPWIGDLIKLFQKRQDNAHELAMLQESNRSTREIAEIKAQVSLAQADVQDVASARQTQPSYGTQLLNALAGESGWVMKLVKGALIMALAAVEIANGWMRPYVVYLVMSMWASTKAARFWFAYTATIGGGAVDLHEITSALASAALAIWDDHDFALVDYVCGFLLGSRHKLSERGAK